MAPVCAVVVAGGSGQRFGNPGGKQLVNVAGRPLMSWSIRAFDRSDKVGHIVVVCPAERRARCAAWPSTRLTMTRPSALPMPAIPARIPPVPACMRFRRALNTLPFTMVLVRSLRPRPSTTRSTCLWGDRALDGVVCGQPAIDTLKIVDGDNIVETPPRELYWAAQTPQIFSVDAMKRAHAVAIAEGFIGTDDSSLVERMGGRVRCVQSPRDNLKVTVPETCVP